MVPAVGAIVPPLIPPMPPMETGVVPIIPSITPSDASAAIAVAIPADEVIPSAIASWDMAASAIP
ncbi:hypothetical protein PSR1_02697 [Anaeromyxobacter sp. PSR-1]|nr:hypothetical protein PSR1_02697 [Anaeromyxobacter sp. PSR-1]